MPEPRAPEQDIAVIGIACRFPGSNGPREFWKTLSEGRNHIREIPPDRWPIEGFYSPRHDEVNRSVSKWGGFLDDVDRFDHRFFNISPREARNMDPQQRLLLEEVWRCVEDSGLPLNRLQQATTGVYAGCMQMDYTQEMTDPAVERDGYACSGNFSCILSNRISYVFGFRGPSLTIDTACSASLVAMHEARLALQNGLCDYAIVAGVSLNLSPWKYCSFSRARMLSPDGQCRTFDREANGYVPGEGVAAILLTRVDAGQRAGAHVYALLKGSAVNHGGQALSLTAPRVDAQRDVIVQAWQSAGLSPAACSYVEAHGTGTSLGDPIEIEALTQAFSRFTDRRQFCRIGSVKTNIGHLEPAAGIAGVIKVLLMMQHRRIAPTLNVRTPNPLIAFEKTPFVLARRLEEWQPGDGIFRAGVSSFGFGGVNSHVVLERAADRNQTPQITGPDEPQLFLLSARSATALEALKEEWRGLLRSSGESQINLAAASRTLLYGRQQFEQRFAVLARSASALERALAGTVTAAPVRAERSALKIGPRFGAGSAGLLKELDSFQRALAECAEAIGNLSDKAANEFSMSYAAARAIQDILPEFAFVAGEGSGVWPALAVAGVLNLRDAWNLAKGGSASGIEPHPPVVPFYDPVQSQVIPRWQLSSEYLERVVQGASFSADELRALRDHAESLFEVQFTFRKNLESWAPLLQSAGLRPERLLDFETNGFPVLSAIIVADALRKLNRKWHLTTTLVLPEVQQSELLDLLEDGVLQQDEMLELLREGRAAAQQLAPRIQERASRIDSAKPYRILRAGRNIFREAGEFESWIAALRQAAAIPPAAISSRPLLALGESSGDVVIRTAKREEILEALRTLWLAGITIRWEALDSEPNRPRISLPTYRFDGERFWIRKRSFSSRRINTEPRQLKRRFDAAADWIVRDHRIGGRCILPAAAMVDLLLQSVGQPGGALLRNFRIEEAAAAEPELEVTVSPDSANTLALHANSRRICSAAIESAPGSGEEIRFEPRSRTEESFLDAKELYNRFRTAGYEYGRELRVVQRCWRDDEQFILELATTLEADDHALHPALLDGVLQAALAAAWLSGRLPKRLYLPCEMGALHVYGDLPRSCFVVVRNENISVEKGALKVSCEVFDTEGKRVLLLDSLICRVALTASTRPAAAAVAAAPTKVAGEAPDAGVEAAQEGSPESSMNRMAIDTEALRAELAAKLSGILGVERSAVDSETDLRDYGLDSVSLTEYAESLESALSVQLDPTQLFEYPTLKALADYLERTFPEQLSSRFGNAAPAPRPAVKKESAATIGHSVGSPAAAVSQTTAAMGSVSAPAAATAPQVVVSAAPASSRGVAQEIADVAIVGVAGRFPGGDSLDEWWEKLVLCEDLVSEIPPDRWHWLEYFGDPHQGKNKTDCKWGGFIREIDKFDAGFFGISPKEAAMMDPQQRLLLELAWHVIEDSGHKPAELSGSRTGVFIGVCNDDYRELIDRHAPEVQAQTSTGTYFSIIPNRISYWFDFQGPSVAIDTACSSSLVALHQAIQAMRDGDCDLAIAGGVNICCTPRKYLSFSKAGMLSPDGRCKTFDARANGYVRGEGAGLVMLKPLWKALEDGDPVYAIVKGTAVNHGGSANSLTAPNPNAQAALIASAWRRAGVSAEQISCIETHGTGTELGDPIEIAGLKKAFRELGASSRRRRCALGSVKTNIGHLESAAGIAGVIKVLLALKHKKLPGTVHFRELNPHIDLTNSPFYILAQTEEWEATTPRRAGVSSFGFGGVNAHVALEEFPMPREITGDSSNELIVLSANTGAQLKQMAAALARWLSGNDAGGVSLRDIAFTLQSGREAFPVRLALLALNKSELREKLERWGAGDLTAVWTGAASKTPLIEDSAEDRDFIESLARAGKLERIARLWLSGSAIPWKALHAGKACRRVSLPGYAFARERHWIADHSVVPNAAAGPAAEFVGTRETTSNATVLMREISASDALVRDHVVKGQAILPGVVYLEFARAAGSNTQKVLRITDAVWLRPIAVNEGAVKIRIRASQEGGYSVESLNGAGAQLHSSGRLHWENTGSVPRVDLSRLQLAGKVTTGAEVYATFAANGVDYGAFYKGLQEVRHTDQELFGRISIPLHGAVANTVLPPPAMDSAVQITLWWLIHRQRGDAKLFLPFSAQEIRIYGAISGECFVHAAAEEVDLQAGFARFNLKICDLQGNAVLEMIDFCIRRFEPESNAGRNGAAEITQPIYFQPVWRRIPAPKETNAKPGRALIFTHAADGGLGSRMAESFADRTATLVFLGREYRKAGDRCYSIHAAAAEDYARVLREAGPFESVYFLGGCGAAVVPQAETAAPVLWIFRLAQALRSAGLDAIQLRVITTDAFCIPGDERKNPAAAAVAAFAQVAGREFSRWDVSVLDFAWAELLHADPAKFIETWQPGVRAVRDGQFFTRVLRPLKFEHEPAFPISRGAVCVIAGGASGLGFETARMLAKERQACLALIGRRAVDAEIEQNLSILKQLGGRAHYIQADIADEAGMLRAREEIHARFGPVQAVFHSALVLKDAAITALSEAEFCDVLAPKIQGTVILQEIFGNEPLDMFVTFSSANSFLANAGQSNYVAACTGQDALMLDFAERRGVPVRVIHWGYWAETGVVAGSGYQDHLAREGIFGFSTEEGITALKRILSAPCAQVMAARFSAEVLKRMGADFSAGAVVLSAQPSIIPGAATAMDQVNSGFEMDAFFRDLARYGELRLLKTCESEGWIDAARSEPPEISPAVFQAVPAHEQLAEALCELVRRSATTENLSANASRLESLRNQIASQWPDARAYLRLIDHCAARLPEVLRGGISPLEVVFPGGSSELVAAIYTGNAISDFFNSVVARGVAEAVSLRHREYPGEVIRIVEIGAGVGGTTGPVLKALAQTGAGIEYCFTDVSSGLLAAAEQKFGGGMVQFRVLDIEKEITEQGFQRGSFDFAVATNVLHATAEISRSLGNVKALLKGNGLLFLNEVTEPQPYLTLSFGLLEGWWRATDRPRRIPHSPLLAPRAWRAALAEAGFRNMRRFGKASAQTVFVAESDGVVEVKSATFTPAAHTTAVKPSPSARTGGQEAPSNLPRSEPEGLQLEAIITDVVATATGQSRENVSAEARFVDLGVDSIIGIGIINRLNRELGLNLKTTTLFNYTSISDLAEHIRTKHQPRITAAPSTADASASAVQSAPRAEPASSVSNLAPVPKAEVDSEAQFVAVIGMSGRFPGARNLDEFWDNLSRGVDSIREVPLERWGPHEKFYSPDKTATDRAYIKVGGFLDDIEYFDPRFFDISPREAELMDPQQRLFLEECWKAIEDAGYSSQEMANRKCGVFAGVSKGDYFEKLHGAGLPLNSHTWIGNETSILSARIAYHLNLKGPAFPVDTACSSSLVALHLACRSILAGECDSALAGGVFILTTPSFYIHTSKTLMLSPEGKCRAFDDRADGFVPGEGAAVVLLKRLDRARADGDHIYGIIRGSGVNQDGRTNGITAPNLLSQKTLLEEVYRTAGTDPETISYVETHGTGTKLGDPIEIDALTEAFGQWTSRRQFCAIGSVKTNIGHTATAAGVAGLIKILLSFQRGQIPPSLHFEKANAQIDFSQTPFFVNTRLREWPREDGRPRRAALSSFGFSGTNAHIVLEEAPIAQANRESGSGPYLFCISAKTKDGREQRIREMLAFLKKDAGRANLADVSFTLNAGRSHFGWRTAVVATDAAQLRKSLESLESLAEPASSQASVKPSPQLNGQAAAILADIVRSPASDEIRRRQKLEALADLYVQGADFNWKELFRGTAVRRIALPAYPFARMRCWPWPEATSREGAAQTAGESAREHVFLRKEWIRHELEAQRIATTGCCLVICEGQEFEDVRGEFPPETNCLLVRCGDSLKKVAEGSWQFSFANPSEAERLCSELDSAGEISSAIHFVAEGSVDSIPAGLLALYQGIARRSLEKTIRFLLVTRGAQAFENAAPKLAGAALAGLVRSLAAEYSGFHATALDLDSSVPLSRQASLILREFFAANPAPEVCCRREMRFVSRLVRETVPELHLPLRLDPAKVYVVTGGTGGLGFEVCKFLIGRGARKLAVLSRTPAGHGGNGDERKASRLRNLEALGATIYSGHPALDQIGQLEAFFSDLRHRAGLIGGIVHCAGTVGDAGTPFVHKAIESAERVLAPKVTGTQLLARVLQHDPLEFFVLFSSIAGIIPRLAVGAADYGAANYFLDAFAAAEWQRGRCHVISINWPSWKETGIGEAKGAAYTGAGFHSITTAEGIELLERALVGRAGPSLAACVVNPLNFSEGQLLAPASADSRKRPPDHHLRDVVRVESAPGELVSFFSRELKIPVEQLDPAVSFAEWGIDSVLVAELVRKLEPLIGAPVDPSLMLEFPTLNQLGAHLEQKHPAAFRSSKMKSTGGHSVEPESTKESRGAVFTPNPISSVNGSESTLVEVPAPDRFVRPVEAPAEEPIAIIGIGCRFPGAENPAEFWRLLREGRSAIREVPAERWSAARWFSPAGERGRSISKWGGFIEAFDCFDAAYFGISDEDAAQMDPLARIFLETSVQTIRDAGYGKEELWNSRTGVFAGTRISSFAEYLEDYCRSTIVGIGQNFIAAQVSQFHNFRGPNLVIDTACSSSLASVHLACQSLRAGECDLALAGGVDLLLNEKIYLMLTEAKALSPSGKCQTFDAKADGYVPGEGAGAVLLKPLRQAQADGDRIYAVIAGSAVNNDGHTMGITTPSLEAQEQLIRAALRKARLTAESISYIEAHGTGTMIGDPIELKALSKAFRRDTAARQFCPVGSVKTNIGHLHSAAGAASLIKVALSIAAGELPPTLNCDMPNPRFEFSESPFYPITTIQPWKPNGRRRIAGISSFGFGGTNCHMILAEQPDHQPKRAPLPPVQFHRKRYWPGSSSEAATERTAPARRAGRRPLLALEEVARP